MKLQQMTASLVITTFLAIFLAGCGLTQPKLLESNMPISDADKSTMTATIELTIATQASFSAELNYTNSDNVALSGLALRLVFPKQDVGTNIEPFIIPETTRAKFWQPLINQVDCATDQLNCFADLALITLSPSGSDFSGLEQIVGLNPELFSPSIIKNAKLDNEVSKATTKEAAIITLDLKNTLAAE